MWLVNMKGSMKWRAGSSTWKKSWSSMDTIIFIYTENYAKNWLILSDKKCYSRNSKQERRHFLKRID